MYQKQRQKLSAAILLDYDEKWYETVWFYVLIRYAKIYKKLMQRVSRKLWLLLLLWPLRRYVYGHLRADRAGKQTPCRRRIK